MFPLNSQERIEIRVPLQLSGLRIQQCHCCGTGMMPGQELPHAIDMVQKKKKKKVVTELKIIHTTKTFRSSCYAALG